MTRRAASGPPVYVSDPLRRQTDVLQPLDQPSPHLTWQRRTLAETCSASIELTPDGGYARRNARRRDHRRR
jgi:hypothetical protein